MLHNPDFFFFLTHTELLVVGGKRFDANIPNDESFLFSEQFLKRSNRLF